jgi:hypothetical protein
VIALYVPIVLFKLHVNRYLFHFIEFNNHQNNHDNPNQSHLLGQGDSLLALIHEVLNEEIGCETEKCNLVSVMFHDSIINFVHRIPFTQ